MATSRAFSAYGRTLNMVPSFKYLRRVLSAADYDWPAVIHNLNKARSVSKKVTRILSREVERPWVSGYFFKSIVQSVLPFGGETWVVTPCMVRVLGFFPRPGEAATDREAVTAEVGRRKDTSVEAAREEAGFDLMETYIW